MEDILTYGIIGGLIGLLMVYLNKSAARQIAPVREDVFELHLHKLYQVIGWIALILGMVLLIVPTVYGGLEGLSVGLIMFVLFAGLGWACLSWHKNHRLTYDSQKIESKSWLGKTSTIHWDNIKTISFNSLSAMIIIVGEDGEKVKAHQHLVGLNSFVGMIEQKTGMTAKELKLPIG